MDYMQTALNLYKITGDQFLLSAMDVLANPDHPLHEQVKGTIERMEAARFTLFPLHESTPPEEDILD